MGILWNTDVNAPCCPGEILETDAQGNLTDRSYLVQTDWDYPGVASSFGWSIQRVQRCPKCHEIAVHDPQGDIAGEWIDCNCDECRYLACSHDATDGTVDCEECGVTNSEFMSAAYDWLRENDGATADDPGYFQ